MRSILGGFYEIEGKDEGTERRRTISTESILIPGESNWIQRLFGLSGLSRLYGIEVVFTRYTG